MSDLRAIGVIGGIGGIVSTVWGLLVEDGSLAISIVAALGATWLVAALLPAARDAVGWLLLVLLIVLVVVNLRAAGERARRAITAAP